MPRKTVSGIADPPQLFKEHISSMLWRVASRSRHNRDICEGRVDSMSSWFRREGERCMYTIRSLRFYLFVLALGFGMSMSMVKK